MTQKILAMLSEWCHDNNVRYDIVEYADGYAISMPLLNIDEIIDMSTACVSESEIEHTIKDGNTLVWIGNGEIREDQLKYPWGKIIRKQSAFGSSINPTRSFGGVTRFGKKKKKNLAEDVRVAGDKQPNTILDAKAGRLYIFDQIVMDNHATILQQLVLSLAKNNAEALQEAIDDIGNTIKQGTKFVGPK